MARIVTVYNRDEAQFRPIDMSLIRWLKISEALASHGHQVDMATNETALTEPVAMSANLRRVPLRDVRWADYDVVKTEFHMGFETLKRHGGADHPFIISKLGSVVAEQDRPDVFFYGEERERLYEIQLEVRQHARYVTLLTRESIDIWRECFGAASNMLLVPGAADRELQEEGPDPYPPTDEPRCLFAGNIYDEWYQADVHRLIVEKLNALGELLTARGVRLFFLGRGDASRLDPSKLTSLGAVEHARSWDYMRHADVGIVLAFGKRQNVNESTKIYHYLRTGLPVICEQGFPNEGLISEANLGYVTPFGDLKAMAERVRIACYQLWDTRSAVQMILDRHTWDQRAIVYDRLIRQN
jgi:hypothetical protein